MENALKFFTLTVRKKLIMKKKYIYITFWPTDPTYSEIPLEGNTTIFFLGTIYKHLLGVRDAKKNRGP